MGILAVAGLGLGVRLFAQAPGDFKDSPFLRIDPDKIVIENAKGQRPCGECHTNEWGVWKETKHAKIFDELHKNESAQEIMDKMGLRSPKRAEALCMRCHYTVGPERKAIAGVSCESCHGPARDWLNVHNKWAGAKDKRSETPEGRAKRVVESRAAGMLRPSTDIYGVTANCFECHTVPSEELVNRGGHSTGTADFSLVTRVDSIRHNFLTTKTNRPLSAEHKRVLFVMGRILGYEYSLRGLANATTNGRYASAMGRSVKEASGALEEIVQAVPIPEVAAILKAGANARLVPNNRRELESLAAQVRAQGERFTTRETGAALARIEPLMAGTDDVAAAEGGSTEASGVAGESGGGSSPGGGAVAGRAVSAPAPEPPPRADMPGQIRARATWFNANNKSGVVGAGKCSKCHGEAQDWWYSDKHAVAGKRLTGENPKARQIAELYGIGAANMARGDRICMSCHGTVDEGTKVVREQGVSCESCHGAGKKYLDPHQKGNNPVAGMTALKRAPDRAQTCIGCHRISDERLLAAGHPTGANYDVAAASNKIKHWPGAKPERERKKKGASYPAVADAALRSAYASAAGGRPIPNVKPVAPSAPSAPRTPTSIARAAGAAGASGGASAGAGAGGGAGSSAGARGGGGSSMPPYIPTGYVPRASTANVSLDAEPLPETTGSMTIEELMLLVKKRIDRIYAATSRGN